MRRIVPGWKRFGGYIVNYADDMVICCRRGAEAALASMRRLTVNETKTRACYLPEEKF